MKQRIERILKLSFFVVLIVAMMSTMTSCFLWRMLFSGEHEHTYGEWREKRYRHVAMLTVS